MFCSIFFFIIIFWLMVLYSIYWPGNFSLYYIIDFTYADKNDIVTTITISNIKRPLLIFYSQVSSSFSQISQLEIYNLQEITIPSFEINQRIYIFPGLEKSIKIKYHIHPGYPGRHGLHGFVDSALFHK